MANRSRASIRLILALIPLAAGCWALWLGQDASWDLRNYHFYNPFAFLNDRMGFDVAVAQVATYYNPLLHLPFYFAVTHFPPKAVCFLLGFIPGLNIFPLYAISKQVLQLGNRLHSRWFCLGTAVVGLLGATNLSELGTSFGDNVVSLPVLGSIWFILGNRDRLGSISEWGWVVSLITGLLTGAALGLKQPFAGYAVGICAAFFGLNLPFKTRFFLAFIFGLGVLAGTALTGGFWMVEMWRRFGNPLFPYFNQYFKSPWAAADAYRDARFIPENLWHGLVFPIEFTIFPEKVGEVPFRDLRFALFYLAFVAWMGRSVFKFFSRDRGFKHRCALESKNVGKERFILIFLILSFILWMKLFSIYRYLAVAEMMAPLGIFLVLKRMILSFDSHSDSIAKWNPKTIALCLFALILITLYPGDWNRRPFGPDYFGVTPPSLSDPDRTLVLMTGHEPMAYMIPFFPSQVRFLRVHGYLTGPSDSPNATNKLMEKTISNHEGELYLIYRSFEEWSALNAMKALGLEIIKDQCQKMLPHVEPLREHPYYFCPLEKAKEP
jgi:hypothetical protein